MTLTRSPFLDSLFAEQFLKDVKILLLLPILMANIGAQGSASTGVQSRFVLSL